MEQTLFDLDNPPHANTRRLVAELKENNQDFEFYPTSKEMVKVIYKDFCLHRKFYYGNGYKNI